MIVIYEHKTLWYRPLIVLAKKIVFPHGGNVEEQRRHDCRSNVVQKNDIRLIKVGKNDAQLNDIQKNDTRQNNIQWN